MQSLGNLPACGPELTERQVLLNRVGSERGAAAGGGKAMQDGAKEATHGSPKAVRTGNPHIIID